jgi:hypothetical protein
MRHRNFENGTVDLVFLHAQQLICMKMCNDPSLFIQFILEGSCIIALRARGCCARKTANSPFLQITF